METENDLFEKLVAFKSKSKFSDDQWESRGLNPSSSDISVQLERLFNKIADDLIEELNHDIENKKLKSLLKKGLQKFNKYNFDTEEKKFICDLFEELAVITNIDLKDELNNWQYGSVLTSMMKLSKILNPEIVIEKIQQNCTKCKIILGANIIEKKEGIPDSSWLVVKCNSCGELNLVSPGPNIKRIKFINYGWVESLNKEEFTYEKALIQLEQIKMYRK